MLKLYDLTTEYKREPLGLDAEANALGDERKGATDDYFTANVCFAWSLQILADTAAVLQYAEDARRWSRRREEIVRAFRAEYVTPTGRLVSETQTALILALHFDMVPDEFRPRLLDALEKNIGAHKTHLLTGFIGTPLACLTLPEQTETLTLGSGSYRYEYATETNLKIDRYSLETPLHIILEHPAAQAIFRQYAPEFLENPMLEYVKDEPITALLAYGESMRPLFEQVLTAMNQADKR